MYLHGSYPASWTSTRVFWDTINGALSATDTTLVTDNTTGWSAGDELYILSDTDNQSERAIIDSITGTSITLTSGLTYAHPDGVILINITRNIKIFATNSSYKTYIRLDASTASLFKFNNVFFDSLGDNVSYTEYGLWLRANQGSYINNSSVLECRQAITTNSFSAGDGLELTNTCVLGSLDKGLSG